MIHRLECDSEITDRPILLSNQMRCDLIARLIDIYRVAMLIELRTLTSVIDL